LYPRQPGGSSGGIKTRQTAHTHPTQMIATPKKSSKSVSEGSAAPIVDLKATWILIRNPDSPLCSNKVSTERSPDPAGGLSILLSFKCQVSISVILPVWSVFVAQLQSSENFEYFITPGKVQIFYFVFNIFSCFFLYKAEWNGAMHLFLSKLSPEWFNSPDVKV
jgi:hypothetical protein